MKLVMSACIAAAAFVAAPLAAQSNAPEMAAGAPNVAAGASVYDTTGATVGTVDSVTAGVAVVNTGTNKVGLPLTSFAAGEKGPTIAMTKVQLDEAAGKAAADAAAALKAQLTPGATVYGKAGTKIGTIKEADDQYVTVTVPKGPIKLPISAFGKGDAGPMISMTAEELDKAMASAAPAK
jgi:hypothetical protein